MFEDITFPVFRKYKNNKHFFKIISSNSFEEIQIVGNKKIINLLDIKTFPDLSHIREMVYNKDVAIPITEQEYYLIKVS